MIGTRGKWNDKNNPDSPQLESISLTNKIGKLPSHSFELIVYSLASKMLRMINAIIIKLDKTIIFRGRNRSIATLHNRPKKKRKIPQKTLLRFSHRGFPCSYNR